MIVTTGPITWASAHYLLFLIPLALGSAFLVIGRFVWQKKSAQLLSSGTHNFLRNFSLARKFLKSILLVSAVFLLVLALARPQWNTQEQNITQEGRDVLIALDISRSMLASDEAPTRLEHAKDKIKTLINRLTAERVGLIVFSSDALMQCPLTADMTAFLSFLEATDAETISSGTTALDQALEKALQVFQTMPSKKHKLLLIFTDGEDFSAHLQESKQKAQDAGLHVITVGVGTPEGAPIPVLDEEGAIQGHQKDEQGRIVISRLNESVLAALAQDSKAFYVRTTQDDKDIESIVNHVRSFEKEKFEDKRFAVKEEKYYYFGIGALVCLLIEWLL